MKSIIKHGDTLLLIGAWLCLLAALFHPTIPLRRDLHNYLLVVDVTQSMNTTDMMQEGKAISRIAYTRQLLQETVTALPCGTQVSLGVFSAENIALLFTPIEVCNNYDVIQNSIQHLEWRMAWRGNSRLRFAMHSITAILSTLKVPSQVVFFTDGDEAPMLNAVNKLDLSGWQGGQDWVIVGVGGDEPSPIPKLDSENKILGYWAFTNSILAPSQTQSEESVGTRDNSIATDDYERYLSKLDETYLKELSVEIGAKYHRASESRTLVEAMRNQKAAGSDIVQIQIDWMLILAAISLVLAGYWQNFKSKFQFTFNKATS